MLQHTHGGTQMNQSLATLAITSNNYFYLQDQGSLIIDGTCQIPDPLYKFIGSIICFYIPLLVMLVTYALTVRLLANQKQSLGTPEWSNQWMAATGSTALGKANTMYHN